jgi:hypothetical protein
MTTEETVEGYFEALKQKKAWDDFLAEDRVFFSHAIPSISR